MSYQISKLSERSIRQMFAPMIALLEEDCQRKLHTVHYDPHGAAPRLFLIGETLDGEICELMLRLNQRTKTLTVARIGFVHTQVGFGRKMLGELLTFGRAEGYEKLVFESVMTKAARSFLFKHGFTPQGEDLGCLDWEYALA